MSRRRAPVATPQPQPRTALFDTSPASKQPYTWGRVPHRDEALTIAGQPPSVLYSYIGAMECGKDYQYVLLVRYSERMDATAARVVVLAGWVLEEKAVTVG